jgi:hypothetical protein
MKPLRNVIENKNNVCKQKAKIGGRRGAVVIP